MNVPEANDFARSSAGNAMTNIALILVAYIAPLRRHGYLEIASEGPRRVSLWSSYNNHCDSSEMQVLGFLLIGSQRDWPACIVAVRGEQEKPDLSYSLIDRHY